MGGGGGIWDPKLVYHNWPKQMCPSVPLHFLPLPKKKKVGEGEGGVWRGGGHIGVRVRYAGDMCGMGTLRNGVGKRYPCPCGQ